MKIIVENEREAKELAKRFGDCMIKRRGNKVYLVVLKVKKEVKV